jgi:hypothetical protein
MKTSRFLVVASLAAWLVALLGALLVERRVSAQAPSAPSDTQPAVVHAAQAAEGRKAPGPLVRTVRDATRKYQSVAAAEADGYALMFGCVSGAEWGAMGLHYVNLGLVLDGELDPARPEIVIYEPQPDGTLRLVGADYLVFAEAWHATNVDTPKLMGQLMHLFESPNRYGLPPFYTLHVWAWRDNPNGSFVNWHPHVSCDAYRGAGQ